MSAPGRRPRFADLLHARRRRAVAAQGGFALMAVLASIAVTSLLIGALFGLMLTTMRITAAQERNAREERAADAAIETAINLMRDEPCDPAAQPYLDDQLHDQQTAGTGDDVSVDVTCSSVGGSNAATDQVRIVGGDGYKGALKDTWTLDCASNASTPGCMPWSSVGSPGGLAGSQASLIHSGHEPLRFSSGLTVRTGAAALRNPTSGTPAVEVGGDYNQGSPGIGGAGGSDCGILGGSPGNGVGKVTDMDDSPSCGVNAAATVDAQPTGNVSGLVASTAVPTVPSCAGAVVAFDPGTYSASQTESVSRLTDGSNPSCRNKTFHFRPGIYSFAGTELRFGDAGSYYVFGAPTTWGGAGVQASAALVDDPDAALCDPFVSGTSLILSGWTKITHTKGRVAICPNRPTSTNPGAQLEPHPAIYQQTSVPTQVLVSSINRTPAPNGITLPFNCRTGSFQYGFDYPGQSDYPGGIFGACRPLRVYHLNLATDGAAPVQSLRVMLTGAESSQTPNNFIRDRRSQFFVLNAGGAELCRTNAVSGMPNGGLTSSFDLKALPGSCSSTSLTQTQLDGGRIVVEHSMELTNSGTVQSFTLSKAEVEINAVNGSASVASSSDWSNADRVLAEGGDAAAPVMPCPDFVCAVPDPGRTITPATPFRHEMTVSDFSFPGLANSSNPTLDPSLRTLRAVVRVTPSALTLPQAWIDTFGNSISTQNFLLPTTAYMELRSPAGGRCIVQGTGMNSDQEIAFDLLDPNLEDSGPSGCNTVLFDSASDLQDLTLKLRFEVPCLPNYLHNVPWECLRSNVLYNPGETSPIWQLRPPNIDSVRLTTVTDTYTTPQPSTVTVYAAQGPDNASFNVFGRTWMPLADIDLNWNGPATISPLFSNDLVVHGIGSRMAAGAEMGTVCCSPPDARTVELIATIDGVERLTARVEYTDVDSSSGTPVYRSGYKVDVLRWLTCGSAGCASVLAETDENPP